MPLRKFGTGSLASRWMLLHRPTQHRWAAGTAGLPAAAIPKCCKLHGASFGSYCRRAGKSSAVLFADISLAYYSAVRPGRAGRLFFLGGGGETKGTHTVWGTESYFDRHPHVFEPQPTGCGSANSSPTSSVFHLGVARPFFWRAPFVGGYNVNPGISRTPG